MGVLKNHNGNHNGDLLHNGNSNHNGNAKKTAAYKRTVLARREKQYLTERARVNRLALWSIILSATPLLIPLVILIVNPEDAGPAAAFIMLSVAPPIGSIGAVVLGHIAQTQIKSKFERGRILAIAAVVVGYTVIAPWVAHWVLTAYRG